MFPRVKLVLYSHANYQYRRNIMYVSTTGPLPFYRATTNWKTLIPPQLSQRSRLYGIRELKNGLTIKSNTYHSSLLPKIVSTKRSNGLVRRIICSSNLSTAASDEGLSYLKQLNEEQSSVVTSPITRPIRVLAGPGSGKTRVLTARVAHLIDKEGVPPSDILCITFTNKAANELRERLAKLLGSAAHTYITVGTFHSVGARMLRRTLARPAVPSTDDDQDSAGTRSGLVSPSDLLGAAPSSGLDFGLSPNFTIYDQEEARSVVSQVVQRKLQVAKTQFRVTVSKYMRQIDAVKGGGEVVFESPSDRSSFGLVFSEYERALRLSNAVDFHDLIALPVELLKTQPHEMERWQARFRHILVDEFQDTSSKQFEMVQLLAARQAGPDAGSVFVVGDHNQAIYSWRGAVPENLLSRFQAQWPQSNHFHLQRNYRSNTGVQAAAAALISQGKREIQSVVQAGLGRSEPLGAEWTGVAVSTFPTQDEEAEEVARLLKLKMENEGSSLADFAVLYRSHRLSMPVQRALLREGVPFTVTGAISLYNRMEVKDLTCYLRLLVNPTDEAAFLRVINVPPRSLGQKSIANLREWSRRQLASVRLQASEEQVEDEETSSPSTTTSPSSPEASPASTPQDVHHALQAALHGGAESVEERIDAVMASWAVDQTAGWHTQALGQDQPALVYLLVASGGMKSFVGHVRGADLLTKLQSINLKTQEQARETNTKPLLWRVAAVVSGLESESAAVAVVKAWRGMKNQALSPNYAAGKWSPPDGSLWSQVPAVLRRTQQLGAVNQPRLQGIMQQAYIHWVPDNVLLDSAQAADEEDGEGEKGEEEEDPTSSIAAALATLDPAAELPPREEVGLGPRAYASLRNFHTLMVRLRGQHAERSPADTLRDLVQAIGYSDHLNKLEEQSQKQKSKKGVASEEEEGEDDMQDGAAARWNIVETLIAMGEEEEEEAEFASGPVSEPEDSFDEESPLKFGIQEYLDRVALASSGGEEGTEAVRLMTIHSSKGLEFEAVYIIGCSDGKIPLVFAREEEDFEKLEEEKRLFYVAITRASSRLFISYSTSDSIYNYNSYPSRFLKPLGNVLIPGHNFNEETSEMETLRKGGWQLMQTWL